MKKIKIITLSILSYMSWEVSPLNQTDYYSILSGERLEQLAIAEDMTGEPLEASTGLNISKVTGLSSEDIPPLSLSKFSNIQVPSRGSYRYCGLLGNWAQGIITVEDAINWAQDIRKIPDNFLESYSHGNIKIDGNFFAEHLRILITEDIGELITRLKICNEMLTGLSINCYRKNEAFMKSINMSARMLKAKKAVQLTKRDTNKTVSTSNLIRSLKHVDKSSLEYLKDHMRKIRFRLNHLGINLKTIINNLSSISEGKFKWISENFRLQINTLMNTPSCLKTLDGYYLPMLAMIVDYLTSNHVGPYILIEYIYRIKFITIEMLFISAVVNR